MTTMAPAVGVALYQYLDAREVLGEVALAERLGYRTAWFGDSQTLWREPYVMLGAAAARTSRIGLGVAVTNALTRHPTVTASGMATLQELSSGRGLLGVGVGFSSARTTGLRPSTRAELRAFAGVLGDLCAGSATTLDGHEVQLGFGAGSLRPPVLVGGSGPKMLELAGEVADGVIVGRYARSGIEAMLFHVAAGRERRPAQDAFMTCVCPAVAVDRDRRRALDAVRPHVARSLMAPKFPLSERARAASERMRVGYDIHQHMRPGASHAELVPDEVVAEFAIAGTADECQEHLRFLVGLGVDEVSVRPYAVAGASRADMLEAFATQVARPVLGSHADLLATRQGADT